MITNKFQKKINKKIIFIHFVDTPGGQRVIFENNKLKRNDSNTSLKRRDSDSSNTYSAPQEKSPRPTSLFRMGGKLFQDGSSREHSKKNVQENRVQSMSNTAGRNSLFATAPLGNTFYTYSIDLYYYIPRLIEFLIFYILFYSTFYLQLFLLSKSIFIIISVCIRF